MTSILAWHFTGDTLRDGRPIPPIGEWLIHEGPIDPCVRGLHASRSPFDALRFAPGAILHRVELGGEVIPHGSPEDKLVARKRRIIASLDADNLLRRFAADQALSVSHMWDMPAIVREYLITLDESKLEATQDVALEAACKAAQIAARAAARATARATACKAAQTAARDAAREEFNSRVYAAFAIDRD